MVCDGPLPRLAGPNSNPLRLTAVGQLAVRLQNTKLRIPFVVTDQLAVPVLLGTAFIDAHVRSIHIDAQRLERRQGGSVAIVDGKGEPTRPTRRNGHQLFRAAVREESPESIRVARWVTIPPMSQARIRVTTAGSGLVFMEPKPSLQRRHRVRLTNSVAEVLPNQAFDVIVANFSRQAKRLPKRTVVGYAKRNPLAILTPERRVGAEIAHALHLTDLDVQVRGVGAGRPSSPKNKVADEDPAGTEDRPGESPLPTGATAQATNKNPKHSPENWEEEMDLSYIEDDKLCSRVLDMLRNHSSL